MMKYDKIETTNVACYIGEYQTRNEYLKKDVFYQLKNKNLKEKCLMLLINQKFI